MPDIFSYCSIENYFTSIYNELNTKANHRKIELTREWLSSFPKQKGVYFIYEKDQLKYVGETGSIFGRMRDLLNTKNHTLRRSIGERHFIKEIGYKKANSKKSYNDSIEILLNDYIKKNFTVSFICLEIGRREFEEWIIDKHQNVEFYNKRKKRKN